MKKQKSEDGMAENKPVFVLDSFAVLAHFQAEDGGERVLELLENAREDKLELAMSLIKWAKSFIWPPATVDKRLPKHY